MLVEGLKGFRRLGPRGMLRRFLDLMGIAFSGLVAYAAFSVLTGREPVANHAPFVGLAVAYAASLCHGIFVLLQERARGTQDQALAPQPRSPSRWWSRPATLVLRVIEYSIGLGVCGWVLFLGTEVKPAAERWLERNAGDVDTLLLTGFGAIAGLIYGQLVTAQAIKALNLAADHDWSLSRRTHYLLASGPFIYVLPIVPEVPSIAFGISVQLATLAVGYTMTQVAPLGCWRRRSLCARNGPSSVNTVIGVSLVETALDSPPREPPSHGASTARRPSPPGRDSYSAAPGPPQRGLSSGVP